MPQETIDVVREWAALSAAIASGLLFVFMAVRSPRNIFALLLAAMVACTFVWNLCEWFDIRHPESKTAYRILGVALAFLPALYFHLALQLGRRRVRPWLLVLGYGFAGALALTPFVAYDYYHEGGWNRHFIIAFTPLLAASFLLLGRRVAGARTGARGIFAFPLVAAVVLAPFGLLDLAGWGIGAALSGVAAVVACLVLAWGILRYRVVFDSIEILRESTARVLDALSRGLVSFDHRGTTTFCNDAAATLLGARPRRVDDLPPDLREIVASGGTRYAKQGARILRVAATRPEGPLQRARPVHLLIEDHTHEYQLLHELSHRESLASLGEAAATLAHEIRNPLSAIRSTVDTLSRDTPPQPSQLERLAGEVKRLDDLVERSLHLSRPIELRPEPCDLNALLERIAARVPPPTGVELTLADKLPQISADPDLIGQVFDNLIRNAAEAGAAGVGIATGKNGAFVVASVRNAGAHLPPDVLGRLFQPFVTTKASGAGVGLALCKKIVTAHGGEIAVANVEGGVEFEVRLPWTS